MHAASKISLACSNVVYLLENRRFLEGDMGTIVLVTIGITVYTQVKKRHVPHTSRLPKELTLMASVLLEGGVARHQAGIHSHSEGLHNAAIRVLMHEGCK